ncbi:glycoside hydrolase family 3 protein [Mycena alexandri]|uniref:xylan 1,4-beta-xylosidase n=1 Tax=Mycena alexandri TaxID=1745969 RepID=A0AAD6TF19_9AGAR|nr:glycoside hydrolase family 3 protein [Mycena alexandri]
MSLGALVLALGLYAASPVTATFPDCVNGPLASNPVCDTTKDPITRAQALIARFNSTELIANTVNQSPGVSRLGLAPYQWWNEALHGLATGHGISFASSGNFSFATSFPQPIILGAAFDDPLVKSVATTISTEVRAFNNAGRAGLDVWTPNVNPFRDARWGRGQETPGEDPFHVSQYVLNLVDGLQGGIDPQPYYKVMADCKHFAGYDLESSGGVSRHSFNAIITTQELSEYYLTPFQTCVRDAKVASVMCSYNSVNGVPSCANSYLLQTILRDYWGFADDRWVVSDCDAVSDIFATHDFTSTIEEAAGDALTAGTDINCGTTFSVNLLNARNENFVTQADISNALVRQYASLVRAGYFDPAASQPYRQLGWSDVSTSAAQTLAYNVAAEGMVLLKNSGNTLPLKAGLKIALIGPSANATVAMQGNYFGTPPFLISPMAGAIAAGYSVTFVPGTTISGTDSSGFAAAVAAAEAADAIVYAGGLDNTVEAEGLDRSSITWPGVQLNLIQQLAAVGKPLVVVQFGGGQVDNTALKANAGVGAILWAGYPGQSGGTALFDIIRGKVAPAGRLPLTQYPATYTSHVAMSDMNLRPNTTTGNPGRTYKWYAGETVYPFGTGLHYTTFALAFQTAPATTYSIATLVANAGSAPFLDLGVFDTFSVSVHNTGTVASDFVSLLFVSSTAGPAPHPIKELISYSRVHGVAAGATTTTQLKVTLGSIARTDVTGSAWLFPGSYTLSLDVPQQLTHAFTLTGTAAQLTNFPQPPA